MVFSVLERPAEIAEFEEARDNYEQAALWTMRNGTGVSGGGEVTRSDARGAQCAKRVKDAYRIANGGVDKLADNELWTVSSCIFFCFTILSTIGYGSIAPVTSEGRIFTIIFAMLGIPPFCYLLTQAENLSLALSSRAYHKCNSNDKKDWTFFRRVFYAILLILVLCLGGFAYVACEGWIWTESVYFSFVTLSTIGFGDFTPISRTGQAVTCIYVLVAMGSLTGIFGIFQQDFGSRLDRWVKFLHGDEKEKNVFALVSHRKAREPTGKARDSKVVAAGPSQLPSNEKIEMKALAASSSQ